MTDSTGRPAISITDGGRAVLVRPTGELDVVTGELLEDARRRASDDGARGIVVVLDGVDFLGSSGLSALVEARRRADHAGLGFALAGGSRSSTRVLEITGLTDSLGHHPELADAVAAATESRAGA